MAIPSFEQETTIQFTWVSSVAPDTAPTFAMVDALNDTVISSFTAVESDSTHYFALQTMPNSNGFFIAEWSAIKTFQGSVRNFIAKQVFKVSETNV